MWHAVSFKCVCVLCRYVLDNQYTSSSGAKFPVKWSPPEVFNFSKYSSMSDVWSYGEHSLMSMKHQKISLVSVLTGNLNTLIKPLLFCVLVYPGVLMWEVFTEGRMPFEQHQNHEVVTLVTQGHRLYRPKIATPAIYDIMQLCWHEVTKESSVLPREVVFNQV